MKSNKLSGGEMFSDKGMAPKKNQFGKGFTPYTGNVKSKGSLAKPSSTTKASIKKPGKK